MAYFVLGALLGTLLAVRSRDILYRAPGAQWSWHTHLNSPAVISHLRMHTFCRDSREAAAQRDGRWPILDRGATAGMAIGFVVPAAALLLWTGSVAQFAGILLGVVNLWITIR
jgi:hypothetical protein